MNETKKTPIEVLLNVDENGAVSAKNVYEFLELDPSNYSRWCKKKIEENVFVEENVDFTRSSLMTNGNPNPTMDYKLSIAFAKKLCMIQKNERGEQARNYFIGVENALKKLAHESTIEFTRAIPTINAVTKYLRMLIGVMEKQGNSPKDIAEAVEVTCRHYKLPLPSCFTRVSPFEQLSCDSDIKAV